MGLTNEVDRQLHIRHPGLFRETDPDHGVEIVTDQGDIRDLIRDRKIEIRDGGLTRDPQQAEIIVTDRDRETDKTSGDRIADRKIGRETDHRELIHRPS